MPRLLTAEQIERFERNNFLAQVDVLTPDEAGYYRRCLQDYEAQQGGAPLDAARSRKVHVREPWAAELVRHPRVLDAIEDIIGADCVCKF